MPSCEVIKIMGSFIEKTSVKDEDDLGGFALNYFEGDWGLEKSDSLYLNFCSTDSFSKCSDNCSLRLVM